MEAEQYILKEIPRSRTLQAANLLIMKLVILYVYEYQYLLSLSDYFVGHSVGFKSKINEKTKNFNKIFLSL
jgi:hypothetical protein